MATLVFDIETTAQPLQNFDEAQQECLFCETEKIDDLVAKDSKRQEITRFMSMWPFTSQVVCIAMLNAETQRGQSLFIAEDFEEETDESAPVKFVPYADEFELLTAFWDVAKHYDNVVTFNGCGFDVPFIYLRSALLNVPISKKNWLGYRYATEPHCNLRGAVDVLQHERTRRRGPAVQPGLLLQGLRHRTPQKPRRLRHGRIGDDGRGQIPRNRRILPARRPRHRGTMQNLEGKIGRNKMKGAGEKF
jgi:hypothetical protein